MDPITSEELAAFNAVIGNRQAQRGVVSSVDEIAERAAKKLLADYRADLTDQADDSRAEVRLVKLLQIGYRMSLCLQQDGPGMLKAAHSNSLAFAAIIESRF